MGYWKSNPPLIWIDTRLALFEADQFRVVDGGAAGELFEPFDAVSEFCEVYTFEPRGAETVEHRGRVNIDAGLWSERSRLVLHVASEPTTSSIYPPNMPYLERFPAKFGSETRRTAQRVEMQLTSIDAEVAKGTLPKPNFVKLDVHSAEFEAIVGCLGNIDECLGLLVETWHAPVHRGQHLNGEVEALLQESGFQLYDTSQASAWPHALDGESPLPGERRQLVGSESLFLRETPPPHLWAQYLALLELFGYATLAVRICNDMLAGSLSHTTEAGRLEEVRRALLENRGVRASLVDDELKKAKQARLEPLYREKEAKKALQVATKELELLRRRESLVDGKLQEGKQARLEAQCREKEAKKALQVATKELKHMRRRASLVSDELKKAKQARLEAQYGEREAKKALQVTTKELELLRRERLNRQIE